MLILSAAVLYFNVMLADDEYVKVNVGVGVRDEVELYV